MRVHSEEFCQPFQKNPTPSGAPALEGCVGVEGISMPWSSLTLSSRLSPLRERILKAIIGIRMRVTTTTTITILARIRVPIIIINININNNKTDNCNKNNTHSHNHNEKINTRTNTNSNTSTNTTTSNADKISNNNNNNRSRSSRTKNKKGSYKDDINHNNNHIHNNDDNHSSSSKSHTIHNNSNHHCNTQRKKRRPIRRPWKIQPLAAPAAASSWLQRGCRSPATDSGLRAQGFDRFRGNVMLEEKNSWLSEVYGFGFWAPGSSGRSQRAVLQNALRTRRELTAQQRTKACVQLAPTEKPFLPPGSPRFMALGFLKVPNSKLSLPTIKAAFQKPTIHHRHQSLRVYDRRQLAAWMNLAAGCL